MADDDPVTRLLARLTSEPGKNVPTGLFGRARRTASAALRTGTSALLGGGKIDARTAERLALSLGELKGIAMRVGLRHLPHALQVNLWLH